MTEAHAPRDVSARPWPLRSSHLLRILFWAAIAVLVALRFFAPGPLWLDETLSVNISRLPIPDLLTALTHDGSPPAYYLILHGWMAIFGEGTFAVRALSGVISVAALPVMGLLAYRLGGRVAVVPAVLALAACPFAIRFGSETRMYALVMLLLLLWLYSVAAAWKRPDLWRLALIAVLSGALALTHYWTLFFLVAAELLLLWRVIRDRRGAAWRIALAVPVGGVLFLPWFGSFLFQVQHTGTPWAGAATFASIPSTLAAWGGPGAWGIALALIWMLVAIPGWRTLPGRYASILAVGGLVLGVTIVHVLGAGIAARYSAPMVATGMLGVGLGVARLRPRLRLAALTVIVALGLATSIWSPLLAKRTEADVTAAIISAQLKPGDLVVYCPDQLSPPVARLIPQGTDQVVYPTMMGPDLIDWVDYAKRNSAGDPVAFAKQAIERTSGAVWLFRADGYLTFGDQCAQLDTQLTTLLGNRVVLQRADPLSSRPQTLIRYGSG